MVDALWDWLDEGKNALDGFREYAKDTFRDIVSELMRSIVLKNVVGSFSDDMAALYERYAEGRADEMTLAAMVSDRVSALSEDYARQLPALQKMLEEINDGFGEAGINLKNIADTGQEKQRGGFETLSQETGGFLLGQFTAIRIHTGDLKDMVFDMMLGFAVFVAHLAAIEKNTADTVKEVKALRDEFKRARIEGFKMI
jgi:hypothetical protein